MKGSNPPLEEIFFPRRLISFQPAKLFCFLLYLPIGVILAAAKICCWFLVILPGFILFRNFGMGRKYVHLTTKLFGIFIQTHNR